MQIICNVHSTKELNLAVAKELLEENKPEIAIAKLLEEKEKEDNDEDRPECG